MIKSVLTLVLGFNSIKCKNLEPYIYNGEDSNITDFSHSTCLSVRSCDPNEMDEASWMCGSSILNQRILLTAAHCVYGCLVKSILTVQYGSDDRQNASFIFVKKYKVHPNYEEYTTNDDIALVLLMRPLELDSDSTRVTIYPKSHVPYNEEGVVAGWGYIDDEREILSSKLQHIVQKIIRRSECQQLIGEIIPKGVICGSKGPNSSYVTSGDSGSALMVLNYIQVGVVSYKSQRSKFIAMYTDVGYFYDWIAVTAPILYCCECS